MWLQFCQKASPTGMVLAGHVMTSVLMSLQTFTSSHSHCVNVLNQVLACVASHIRLLLYMQIKYMKYNYSFLSIYSVLTSAWI